MSDFTNTNVQKENYAWTVVAVAALAVALLIRLYAVFQNYPIVYPDELNVAEPAIHYAQHGYMASPSLAEQLPLSHSSYKETPFGYFPVFTWVICAAQVFFPDAMEVRRGVDLLVGVLMSFLLFRLLRKRAAPCVAWAGCSIFVLHPAIWWSAPCRPDPLSACFGMAAALCVMGTRTGGLSNRNFFAAGFLLGLSAITHPFGGIMWSCFVSAEILFSHRHIPLHKTFGLCFAGGCLGLSAIAFRILPDTAVWIESFNQVLKIKQSLNKDMFAWLSRFVVLLFGGNVVVSFFGLFMFWKIRKSGERIPAESIRWLALICAMAFFHGLVVEYKNTCSFPHFWAVFLLAIATMVNSANITFRIPEMAPRLAAVLLFSAALGGWVLFPALPQLFSVNHRKQREKVCHMLSQHILPQEKTLSSNSIFLDVPSSEKTVLWWHENLDVRRFKWIVMNCKNDPNLSTDKADQFVEMPTRAQAHVIEQNFKLVASTPAPQVKPFLFQRSGNTFTWTAYLYRNNTTSDK